MLTIGLAGNPNAGKSTLFNALTGARQHVGNWPGKTVEKKEGRLRLGGHEIVLVDLPGTYSLTAYSVEEIIARDFIVESRPQAVLCVLDAANLERNLYLVIQIMEMQVPVIVALNMSDVAESRGIEINTTRLSEALGGIPVIRTIGSRDIGVDALRNAITEITRRSTSASATLRVDLGQILETEICRLQTRIEADSTFSGYPAHWIAIKLLENDPELMKKAAASPNLLGTVSESSQRLMEKTGEEPDTLIADARYAFIGALVKQTVKRPAQKMVTFSDKLDRILTHRLWGLPIFLGLMWVVFQLTANVSAPFLDFVDALITGPITRWISTLISALGLHRTWLEALVLQGIIPGVGGVLVFVPVLLSLYLVIALLEDTGYMARAAFVMDRLMSRLGLHGKSFLPLLVGFGCTVPAVYATRTLENERDRKITGFLATFMSCGARLPVYVLFGSAFFGAAGGNLIFAMYLTGIGVAILTSLLFTKIIFRGKPVPPFVMELPPYRAPNARIVLRSTWERTASFVRKAGTVIFGVSIVVWLLLATPARAGVGGFNTVAPSDSLFGTASRLVAPVFTPAGFGQWQASGALITGVLAKEVIVSTMSQVYIGEAEVEAPPPTLLIDDLKQIVSSLWEAVVLTGQEVVNIVPRTVNIIPGVSMPEANFRGTAAVEAPPTALQAVLSESFSPLSAVSFCVFILLYVPCMAAGAAMRHEFGWKWMLAQAGYALGVAWLAAVLVFQVGRLIGWGG